VPARDFALSKQFYVHLGFMVAWSDDDLAYLRYGHCGFLLQDFYSKEHADNFMMHLLVSDVGAWWRHVEETGLVVKHGVPPSHRPTAHGACATSSSLTLPACSGASRRTSDETRNAARRYCQ
jgi:hypothetical protein